MLRIVSFRIEPVARARQRRLVSLAQPRGERREALDPLVAARGPAALEGRPRARARCARGPTTTWPVPPRDPWRRAARAPPRATRRARRPRAGGARRAPTAARRPPARRRTRRADRDDTPSPCPGRRS